MKKYAFVAINFKEYDENEVYVRRVLIRYRSRNTRGDYVGTKYIDCDDYFKDPEKSHIYKFRDKDYKLVKGSSVDNILEGVTRKYHVNHRVGKEFIWEIEAKDDEEARKLFHGRKELR